MSRAWNYLTRERPKTKARRALIHVVVFLALGGVSFGLGEPAFGRMNIALAAVMLFYALWESRRARLSSDAPRSRRLRVSEIAYRAVAINCFVFGFLTVFSIGLPFLLLGITLAAVEHVRGRPHLFWPPLAAYFGLIAGFGLTAPFRCLTATLESTQGIVSTGSTQCGSILLSYSGGAGYRPSLLPALLLGVATSFVLAAVTHVLIRRFAVR